jgi:3-oxoadipate enol-lactonase
MAGWHSLEVGPAPGIRLDLAGEGETVMFLHGIGGARSNWHGQLRSLASAGYRGVAIDIRGYGASGDFDGPMCFSDAAEDVLRVADHLRVKQFHLCGLSMGGIIAMEVARRHQARLASLILCDTGPGIASDRSPEEAEAFLAARQKPLLEGLEPADLAEGLARALVSPRAVPDALPRLVESMKALRKATYLKALAAMARYRTPPPLEEVTVPSLVIVGEDDSLTPPAIAERMAMALPDSHLVVIPGAGHLSNIEQPELFDRAMLTFLRSLSRRTSSMGASA